MVSRRQFLMGTAGLAAVGALSQMDFLKALQQKYPNVLMLIVDDLNDWVGAMNGHPNAKTPNIDRLAQQGTLFTNAHASAPLCGPSRASIMTGLAPSTTGIYGHIHDDDIRKASDKTAHSVFLSEYFRKHGYYTAAVGKVFHEDVPEGSFDDFGGRVPLFGPYPEKNFKWDQPKTSTDWGPFPERDDQMPDYDSAHWMADKLAEKHDKPFFMACGFLRPHVPWHVPQKWFDMHPIEEIQVPAYLADDLRDVPEIARVITDHPMMPTTQWAIDKGEYRNIVQAYSASVSFVDSCVGIVLDALENSEYADNTAVVLWGDHGYHIGEKDKFAKMTLWERATRTPLIIKPPKSHGSQVSNKPVSLLDLYPTLVKMCGLPANPNNEGRDLTPLLHDPDGNWNHAVVTTYGANNHAVKTERYRYIRYEDGSEELYDHQNDANEWRNVAADPAYADIKLALVNHLPTENAVWSPKSQYRGNEYFAQKTLEAGAGEGN
ncbi:sulfatase-like hydrolase/transferase [Neiella sp. HB171785]|uniref:Sulfatase-like hydrolase/transferase n=1 Tax=Neiella litorisoli TaxID=2771431 RepID=A0A8J6UG27_9GAMM|nr:sulfatase-like hydrolase/transferase [Neiella litorisoli]MBD1391454.1 sulfatase-like hydrolase/transferase [Neiella litorisoli]